ncbi:hypothetical protein [Gluconobacter cerinus]|uniref:hypothetical protein n=1 Tax=Gluconobacter cerinus TaxID=38307 RepID=UPI001B8B236C|nr:hypothetical protein [Gluconobacter cerinus]MBS1035393.1 hypothetical protein [Gluconobacter cerinus]
MKHLKFLLAALALPLIAQAADVVPNHIRHPLRPASPVTVLRAAVAENPLYVPTLARGGLSSQNKVMGSDGTPFLDDLWRYADSSVQQADIGTTVPGLDSSGNITAPIATSTSTASAGNAAGTFQEMRSYAGIEKSSPVITHGYGDPVTGKWDVPWDRATLGLPWSKVAMEGGHHADDKAFHWLFGQPVSGGLGAVVDLVAMNGMSAGQGTGVTAGGWNGLVNYGELDAVAREEKTGSAPPKFIASSAITDPSGVPHAVTFTAKGATFSPALPAYWSAMLVPGMNVVTNEIAVASTRLWQNNWLTPWLSNAGGTGTMFQAPNTWMGTVDSWTTDSSGNVTGITLDTGWAVYNQNTFGLGNGPSGLVPGVATLDGSKPGLDTKYSTIAGPAILFGVYTKAFPNYQVCELDPMDGKHGDINSPNGSFANQVHQCANEWDFWNWNTVDYTGTLQGLSIDFNSKSKLTNDSYGMLLSGGSALPLGYIAANMLGNAPTFYSPGRNGIVNSLFAYGDLPVSAGSYQELADFGFAARTEQNFTGKLSLVQVRDVTMPDAPDPTTNSQTQSVRIQYTDAGGVNNATPTSDKPWDPGVGAQGGILAFNPTVVTTNAKVPFFHGLGLGAGGSYMAPHYGIIVDDAGNVYVGVSGTLNFLNASGSSVGGLSYNSDYGILYHNLPSEFTRAVNIDQNSSGLTVYNKTSTGSLEVNTHSSFGGESYFNGKMVVPFGTPAASDAPCSQGQIEMDAGYIYSCVASNTWHRVPNGATW